MSLRTHVGAACTSALLAVCASACGEAGQGRATTKARAALGADATATAALGPQKALTLPAGRSSAHYRIIAPSPARYEFDVALDLPKSADIAVQIHTWYGAVFDIVEYKPGVSRESANAGSQDSCAVVGSRLKCFQRYPLLASERPGGWTIVVSKRSRPAAIVRVAVIFHKP
jgi:hypothetical protein